MTDQYLQAGEPYVPGNITPGTRVSAILPDGTVADGLYHVGPRGAVLTDNHLNEIGPILRVEKVAETGGQQRQTFG